MKKQLFILMAIGAALVGCSKSAPEVAKPDDQVAAQTANPESEADSDNYIQGMIDSDSNVDAETAVN